MTHNPGTCVPLCPECERRLHDNKWCRECGCVTNHTTAEHQEAATPRCMDCNVDLTQFTDDPEARACPACAQDAAEYRREVAQ